MILSIFLIGLVFIFNAFSIGKIYKRINFNFNPLTTFLFGILTFTGIIFVWFWLISFFIVTIEFLCWYLLIFQILLLFVYFWNWRYFFISFKFNFKRCAIFILIILSVFIGWLLTNNFPDFNIANSEYENYYSNLITIDFNNSIIFTTKNITNFSFCDYLFTLFFYLLNVPLTEVVFAFYLLKLLFFIGFTSVIMNFIFQKYFSKISNLISFKSFLYFFNISLLVFISFVIDQSIFMGNYWLIIFMVLIYKINDCKYYELNKKIRTNLILFTSFAGIFLVYNFALIYFIGIFFLIMKNQSKEPNYRGRFNFFLIIQSFFNLTILMNRNEWLNFAYLIILSIFFVVILIIFSFKSKMLINKWISNKIKNNNNKIIVFIAFILFMIYLILFLTDTLKINFNFLFLDTYLSLNLEYHLIFQEIIFIFFYLLSILMLILKENKKNNQYNKINFYLKILFFISIWNPISFSLFKLIYENQLFTFNFNFSNFFLLLFIPFFFSQNLDKINQLSYKRFNTNYFLQGLNFSFITSSILLINLL